MAEIRLGLAVISLCALHSQIGLRAASPSLGPDCLPNSPLVPLPPDLQSRTRSRPTSSFGLPLPGARGWRCRRRTIDPPPLRRHPIRIAGRPPSSRTFPDRRRYSSPARSAARGRSAPAGTACFEAWRHLVRCPYPVDQCAKRDFVAVAKARLLGRGDSRSGSADGRLGRCHRDPEVGGFGR